jgi:predicted membrane-bound spermidine synthase
LPFIFGGITVCLALTRFANQTNRLYALDLIGAAVGCLLPIALLKIVSAPAALFLIAIIAALAGMCFAIGQEVRTKQIAAGMILVFAAAVMADHASGGQLLRLQYIKGQLEEPLLFEKWNHFSRITVVDQPPEASPTGWGLSPAFRLRRAPQKEVMLWMDSPAAATPITHYEGNFDNLEYLRYDIVNLVHYLSRDAKVLVVGTGGGRDVLSALSFHQRSVTAVEINRDILRTLNGTFGDFSGHLDRDPRVTFVNDEARSYVARQSQQFDVIQVSLVDTFAASAAGAFVLTENSLYTTQAWSIFLSKLSANGVMTFSRWYFPDRPAEMYRLTALATQSLLNDGITSPREHIIIARRNGRSGVGTMLVSKKPFSRDEVQSLSNVCQRLGFDLVLTPTSADDNFMAEIANGRDLDTVIRSYSLNITPPTDDSPFFFNMLPFRDILHPERGLIGNTSQNTRAIFVLACLSVVVIILTAVCILSPLAFVSERSRIGNDMPIAAYFGAIGLGFMFIEVSQMQRLIVFLGHPTYALSVVLFSLVVFSGLGSSSAKSNMNSEIGVLRLAFLLLFLTTFGWMTPIITRHFQSSTTVARMLIAVAILAPIGFLMGMAFPLGMKLAQKSSSALTPWLWGINGATSVCASVFAVVLSISFGIHSAYWTGVGAYVIATVAYLYESRYARRTTTDMVPHRLAATATAAI